MADLYASDTEYDSSDADFNPPQHRFDRAGSSAVEDFKANTSEDRVLSKKFMKELPFTKGNRGTEYLAMCWLNQFQAYREMTLRVDTSSTPTGEQIRRFIVTKATRTKPKVLSTLSLHTIDSGISALLSVLEFFFKEFGLTGHEKAKIDAVKHKLVEDGKLTTEPTRDTQWVGVFLLRKIVVAMMEDALKNGTLSWDATLSRITSIVLMAAMSTRCGTVGKDWLDEDEDNAYITYSDITLKLVGGDRIEDIQGQVVMRSVKGQNKKQHHAANTHTFKCLRRRRSMYSKTHTYHGTENWQCCRR
ncbi:hypothetical protein V498_07012 [Pseudogymnoascus sp. VKM F-4517 (FW-2822)]|nr:hypothetical protein V498_07012 [Pseudogymnoascus sp. VKM F-4517 (FW-2822)]